MEPREPSVTIAAAVDAPKSQPQGAVDLRRVPADSASAPSGGPQLADDADIIEDEWVAIAKRIVDQYKDDPYALARAIAMLRADYLKKRYSKEIKVAD